MGEVKAAFRPGLTYLFRLSKLSDYGDIAEQISWEATHIVLPVGVIGVIASIASVVFIVVGWCLK